MTPHTPSLTGGQGGEGPTPAHIVTWVGDRYSPNLRRWLGKQRRTGVYGLPEVFRDQDGIRWIGWRDDEGWFIVTRLFRVLTAGLKAEIGAFPPRSFAGSVAEPDFWRRYAAIGRCALDEEHRHVFIGNETRWAVEGDERCCKWCGNHRQQLRRWSEMVERQRWEVGA